LYPLATSACETPEASSTATEVFYGSGASANAAKIANYFGATAKAVSSLAAGHVEVLLGTGATEVPSALAPASSASSSASGSAGNNGAAGGAVTVAAKAKYGIPCVY